MLVAACALHKANHLEKRDPRGADNKRRQVLLTVKACFFWLVEVPAAHILRYDRLDHFQAKATFLSV